MKRASEFYPQKNQTLSYLVCSSGDWTRTSDLWVMSPTSYLLLYPAIYYILKSDELICFAFNISTKPVVTLSRTWYGILLYPAIWTAKIRNFSFNENYLKNKKESNKDLPDSQLLELVSSNSYPFMETRNSWLLVVNLIFSLINSIASTGFISAKYFLKTHIRWIVFSSRSKSSLRVLIISDQ